MARRLIKRFLPGRDQLLKNPSLSWLSHLLEDPNLWHINRKSTSTAVALGLFCAFVPIPTQMLLAAIIAVRLHCNVPISVAMVWLSNPVTIPPIFFSTYLLGAWLTGVTPDAEASYTSPEWWTAQLGNIWWPLVVGSLITGTVLSVLGYWLTNWLWTLNVRSRWRRRSLARPPRTPDAQP